MLRLFGAPRSDSGLAELCLPRYASAYSWSDRQLDDIIKSGNTVSHEHAYTQKINLQKTLEITEISRRKLLNYTKELSIPRKDRNAIFPAKNLSKRYTPHLSSGLCKLANSCWRTVFLFGNIVSSKMVLKFVWASLIPRYLDLCLCESSFHSLLYFTLSHFHKSSSTLLEEIYFLGFHMPKKWPEINMDLDLNLVAC